MDMQPIGSVRIRPLETTELVHVAPCLHGKVTVAEWMPGLDPQHAPSVKLLTLPTDQGRKFYLAGRLNGWSAPREAVAEICSLGLRVAEANGVIPPDQRAWFEAMLMLNTELMPIISEFRTRSYDYGRDFKAVAKDQFGLMLAFQLNDELPPEEKAPLVKDPRLNAAAEDVL